MAKIAVNYEVLGSKSDTLKTIATQISVTTGEMKAEINKLRSAWEGEAAEQMVSRFMALTETFDEKYDVVMQYANFLHKASEELKQVEQNTKKGVDSRSGKQE